MFLKGDKYLDEKADCWTVDYEGISCCQNDVVTFYGRINGRQQGWTLDRLDAYARRDDGRLLKIGQMELF